MVVALGKIECACRVRHLTKVKCKNAAKPRGNGNGQYDIQLRAAEKIGPADEAFRKAVGASLFIILLCFVAFLDHTKLHSR